MRIFPILTAAWWRLLPARLWIISYRAGLNWPWPVPVRSLAYLMGISLSRAALSLDALGFAARRAMWDAHQLRYELDAALARSKG